MESSITTAQSHSLATTSLPVFDIPSQEFDSPVTLNALATQLGIDTMRLNCQATTSGWLENFA